MKNKSNLKGFKTHRFKNNSLEKILHQRFLKEHSSGNDMDVIVFGHPSNDLNPNDYLTEREKKIVLSVIQWTGSIVGKEFVDRCSDINDKL